jgi:hypothetical protein
MVMSDLRRKGDKKRRRRVGGGKPAEPGHPGAPAFKPKPPNAPAGTLAKSGVSKKILAQNPANSPNRYWAAPPVTEPGMPFGSGSSGIRIMCSLRHFTSAPVEFNIVGDMRTRPRIFGLYGHRSE